MAEQYEYWIESPDGSEGFRMVEDRPALSTKLALMGVSSFAIKELLDISMGPKVSIPLHEGRRLWVAGITPDYEGEDG